MYIYESICMCLHLGSLALCLHLGSLASFKKIKSKTSTPSEAASSPTVSPPPSVRCILCADATHS